MQSDKPEAERTVTTGEILGHKTDFLMTQRRDGEKIVITVESVLPCVRNVDGHLVSFPPPRYPWPNVR